MDKEKSRGQLFDACFCFSPVKVKLFYLRVKKINGMALETDWLIQDEDRSLL
jgi:hypothetical protein